MSIAAKLVLAGLAVSLLLLAGCGKQGAIPNKAGPDCGPAASGPNPGNHYGQRNRQFRVYIYTDATGTCYADIDVATLWTKVKGAPVQQTVCWVSDDGNDYNANFKRGKRGQSPFTADNFPIAGSGTGTYSSGPLAAGATGYYDFVIVRGTSPDGQVCSSVYQDPGYRVSP